MTKAGILEKMSENMTWCLLQDEDGTYIFVHDPRRHSWIAPEFCTGSNAVLRELERRGFRMHDDSIQLFPSKEEEGGMEAWQPALLQ